MMEAQCVKQVWPKGRPKVPPQFDLAQQRRQAFWHHIHGDHEDEGDFPDLCPPSQCVSDFRQWMLEAADRDVALPPGIPPLPGMPGLDCCVPSTPLGIERVDPVECPVCGLGVALCQCRLRKICGPLCTSKPKPQPIPELVVRHVVPPRPKTEGGCTFCGRYHIRTQCCFTGGVGMSGTDCECPACQACPWGEALGKRLGGLFKCCKSEPPPWPVPTGPLGNATCFDQTVRDYRAKKAKQKGCCAKADRIPPAPTTGGGITGFFRDAAGISMLAAAEVVEMVGVTLEAVFGPGPHDDCGCLPEPMYPEQKTEQYPRRRPPTSTRLTRKGLFDRINRFLDEVLVDPPEHPPYREITPMDTETAKTGNALVDAGNALLDDLLTTPPSTTVTPSFTPPPPPRRSSLREKVRCIVQCRERCRYNRWDCAGLVFERTVLEGPDIPPPAPRNWIEKILGCASDSDERGYREKIGERLCPSWYNRSKYYCPHCDKNRYTGKRRIRCSMPELQWPIRCETKDEPGDYADFDLRDMLEGQNEYHEDGVRYVYAETAPDPEECRIF